MDISWYVMSLVPGTIYCCSHKESTSRSVPHASIRKYFFCSNIEKKKIPLIACIVFNHSAYELIAQCGLFESLLDTLLLFLMKEQNAYQVVLKRAFTFLFQFSFHYSPFVTGPLIVLVIIHIMVSFSYLT